MTTCIKKDISCIAKLSFEFEFVISHPVLNSYDNMTLHAYSLNYCKGKTNILVTHLQYVITRKMHC